LKHSCIGLRTLDLDSSPDSDTKGLGLGSDSDTDGLGSDSDEVDSGTSLEVEWFTFCHSALGFGMGKPFQTQDQNAPTIGMQHRRPSEFDLFVAILSLILVNIIVWM
jgi:hypothetical protein